MERCFIDSNIFLYAFDEAEVEKQAKAQKLLAKLKREDVCFVSTQVVQEFINIATNPKKLGFKKEDALQLVQSFLEYNIHNNNFKNILDAIKISINTQFSFWDALVLSAAASEDCTVLYSEDLNNGQVVDGVKIVNPFL